MLVSFRMSLNYVLGFLDWILGFTYVKFGWLTVQYLKEVSWYVKHSSLNDSEEVGKSLPFPLGLGIQHPSLNMVAKLVNDISLDVVDTEKVVVEINMLRFDTPGAAAIPVPEVREEVLTEEQFQHAVSQYIQTTGTSGKFFENLRPPEFTGEKKDFEVWQQRFSWYIRNKSAIFASALKEWSVWRQGSSCVIWES